MMGYAGVRTNYVREVAMTRSTRAPRHDSRAAVVLAAGHDEASRELLTRPLGDATVVELAVATVRRVVPADRIVVVVAAGDERLPALLGDDLTYVEQAAPLGTGRPPGSQQRPSAATSTACSSPTATPRCCGPTRCAGCSTGTSSRAPTCPC
ncbi:hypothetical protein [Cellulomonas soli]